MRAADGVDASLGVDLFFCFCVSVAEESLAVKFSLM